MTSNVKRMKGPFFKMLLHFVNEGCPGSIFSCGESDRHSEVFGGYRAKPKVHRSSNCNLKVNWCIEDEDLRLVIIEGKARGYEESRHKTLDVSGLS